MGKALNYSTMEPTNGVIPDPNLMNLLDDRQKDRKKLKGWKWWFSRSSKNERKERLSLRVKTVGYQVSGVV